MAVGPTRGKERLGSEVRAIMDRAGKTNIAALCKAANVSRDTLYNLLNGTHRPRWNNFLAILAAIDATEDEVATLTAEWRVCDDERIPIEFAAELPSAYLRFRRWESDAIEERTIDTYYVPGIFQTPNYAEAVAESAPGLVRDKWKTIAAAERRERQELLHTDQPLVVHSLVDESVLRRRVGGRDVQRDQLARLLEFGALPNVNLHVWRLAAGAFGVHGGAIALFKFREIDAAIDGWIDTGSGMSPLPRDKVQAYSDVWDATVKRACSARESVELIREIRSEI